MNAPVTYIEQIQTVLDELTALTTEVKWHEGPCRVFYPVLNNTGLIPLYITLSGINDTREADLGFTYEELVSMLEDSKRNPNIQRLAFLLVYVDGGSVKDVVVDIKALKAASTPGSTYRLLFSKGEVALELTDGEEGRPDVLHSFVCTNIIRYLFPKAAA